MIGDPYASLVMLQNDEIVVTSETGFAAWCKRSNFPQLKARRCTGHRRPRTACSGMAGSKREGTRRGARTDPTAARPFHGRLKQTWALRSLPSAITL